MLIDTPASSLLSSISRFARRAFRAVTHSTSCFLSPPQEYENHVSRAFLPKVNRAKKLSASSRSKLVLILSRVRISGWRRSSSMGVASRMSVFPHQPAERAWISCQPHFLNFELPILERSAHRMRYSRQPKERSPGRPRSVWRQSQKNCPLTLTLFRLAASETVFKNLLASKWAAATPETDPEN